MRGGRFVAHLEQGLRNTGTVEMSRNQNGDLAGSLEPKPKTFLRLTLEFNQRSQQSVHLVSLIC
jgi:hypothetical protein